MGTSLKIRPYARLLTMLGEQLIRNEQIALAELIKNAYDADADWVKISFVGFETKKDSVDFEISKDSKIIIEDNGFGMERPIIENSWMNPATPNKKLKEKESITTNKGRIIQGEKGIGRFAVLKLGRKIVITTRPIGKEEEYRVTYDFSKYDDDFLKEDGKEKELFLDQLSVDLQESVPKYFVERKVVVNNKEFSDNNHGTIIEISDLKGSWDYDKIDRVNKESQKLESVFDKIFKRSLKYPFNIGFTLNGTNLSYIDPKVDKLSTLLKNHSVLRITKGKYNHKKLQFEYELNGNPHTLSLNDPLLTALTPFKSRFMTNKDIFENPILRAPECGSFSFNFFVFDLAADKESVYYLDKSDKEIVKEHRIYLYRDKIRVSPYGDADNDWLETDKKRGTGKAGGYLSNDQVVGFVEITKKGNPTLKDKTNREGLIEEGKSTRDFIMLIHSFLLYIRQHPYEQYKQKVKQIKEQKNSELRVTENKFQKLYEVVKDNSEAIDLFKELHSAYNKEKEIYNDRINVTEDLAAVGLSVETASHDLMMMLSNGINQLADLSDAVKGGRLGMPEISKELNAIKDVFLFVQEEMGNIQLLFKSSKQKKRTIRISPLLNKVVHIYQNTLKRANIDLIIEEKGGPLTVKCTDAVILQLLINLFDNAIYWLSSISKMDKQICITLNGDDGTLIFSDNGPGVNKDDEPYIFEAFYSGKEEGRGLGLYIARQLLERMGYRIVLSNDDKNLSGANFKVVFVNEEEQK
ncbi:MAG: sensor histidine kinase [Bacteroidales bacterium]|nr:sensor histidine kinase [Bacteroidales bacterium]